MPNLKKTMHSDEYIHKRRTERGQQMLILLLKLKSVVAIRSHTSEWRHHGPKKNKSRLKATLENCYTIIGIR